MIIGPGITIGGGIFVDSQIGAGGGGGSIGSTTSTQTPTIVGGVSTVALTGVSSPASPFSVDCNAYLLNGSTGYLTLPASSNWAFGTGDYTVEWFQYQTSAGSFPRPFSVGTYPSASIAASIEGGSFYVWEASGFRFSNTVTPITSAWHHFAISRINNQTSVYKNGSKLGATYTDNNNITNSSTIFTIGNESIYSPGAAFPGYITSFRVCKGVGVYSGNFTKPTTLLGQTQSANPYGGSNTNAISSGQCVLLLNP